MTGRTYDTAGRRAAAAGNRRAVLDAGLELVLRDGYQATTIRAVAERAGVSPELIYKTFRNKQGLMKAVYDRSIAGDDLQVPLGARPEVAAILALRDPREKLLAYAAFVAGIMHRLGGLLAVLTEADPEIAELRATTDAERLTGVGAFVAHLAEQGILRAGLPVQRAADACWALTSPQVYAQLTGARGWPQDVYVAWLAGVLGSSLLEG
ncbi:helix-turn-helix domain-containing protein [Dactylosporangium sp. NPDC049525]|uniref:TetR/AcrR family transcriptional regulator n=1 Tax=Dactylosporangium sp. NPDC049525 TaxID=3154730 RepID=UPI00341AFBFC